MILPGYCRDCRRTRPVRVDSQGMLAVAMRRIPTGQCQSCADAEMARRSNRAAVHTCTRCAHMHRRRDQPACECRCHGGRCGCLACRTAAVR